MTSRSDEATRAAIYEHYGLTCPPRFATLRNFDNPTYGPKIARVAAKLGTPFMPWQRYVADVSHEVNPLTGLPVYRKIGVTVPRQSGKTSLILPQCAWRGMARPRQRIVYAAQNGTAAREKWEDDQLPALEAAGFLPGEGERLMPHHRAKVRKANGREAIIWRKTKSIHGLHANTERAGHGKTLHLGVADEYFAQVDERIDGAWSPAMITVLDAQRYWYSTMGTSKSVPMNEAVAAGREMVEAGEPSSTAYFDWSAPDGSDRTDPLVWLATMPALCPDLICRCSPTWKHTVTIPTIQAELDSSTTPAKRAEFDRAYMNIPREDDQADADPNVPDLAAWRLLADKNAVGGRVLALAIDVTPLADFASIVAVGEGPGGLLRYVLLEHHPGITWVVEAAVRLKAKLGPVVWVVDEKSRARELLQQLDNAGIRRPDKGKDIAHGDLWIPSVQDIGAGSARFTGLVNTGGIVHLGQPEMDTAIGGARTRAIGDGLFAFGRRASHVDISPLCGGALALAGFEKFSHLEPTDYDLLDSIG